MVHSLRLEFLLEGKAQQQMALWQEEKSRKKQDAGVVTPLKARNFLPK